MKQKPCSIFAKASILPTALGTAFLTLSNAHAADIFKNDTNATGLADPLSWVPIGDPPVATVPGASDIAVWDSTVATADQSTLPALGTSLVFGGIRIANPVSNVGFNVNSGRALSIGTSGIDMSAATATGFTSSNEASGRNHQVQRNRITLTSHCGLPPAASPDGSPPSHR